jgi:photosystem II stability/assembly factor-like uncharacterized protein
MSSISRRWVSLGLWSVIALAGCQEAGGAKNNEPARALVTAADRFFDVKAVREGVFVAVGYKGRILSTEDAGDRWHEVKSPTTTALTQLFFVDAEFGLAVGHAGTILRTQDGGKSWQLQKSSTQVPLFAVDCLDRSLCFAAGDASTFLRSKDGGQTWEPKSIPLSLAGIREDMTLAISDTIYYGVDFVDSHTGWVVGEYGNIRHTVDGGETWDSQHVSLLGGEIRDAMDLPAFFDIRLNGDKGIVVGAQGRVAVTEDAGQTWRLLEKGRVGSQPVYDLTPVSTGGFVLVGAGGLIVRGADDTWQPAKSPGGIYTWLAAADLTPSGKGLAVGSLGILLQTKDHGQSWTMGAWNE